MTYAKDSLARLKQINKENQIPVMVTRGLIKSAVSEIEMQSKLHGNTFAIHITLQRLKAVIGEK